MRAAIDQAMARVVRVALLIAVAAWAGPARAWQVPPFNPPPQFQGDPDAGGAQVLARGPIHEAFAAPIDYNPATGAAVPKAPPRPIEELPPAQKPEGADVEWIPGYWAWDDQRVDFIWISGLWRDIPPGRQWVPGYWNQADDGFHWTSGFWAPANANGQVEYLPAPPPSMESGPNSPQPGDNFAWAPGSWVWRGDRYVWSPGYWFQAQQDWIWVPNTYVSTPSGYAYVSGYWDYSINRRGVPFAPVAFAPGFAGGPNFAYTPSYVLPAAGLLSSLFIRPNYNHYYFGDYYGSAGGRGGYVPWFGYQQQRLGYDPLYASMAANNARQPNWDRQIREQYNYRVNNVAARPAPTFAGQRALVEARQGRGEDVRGYNLAQPFGQFANNPGATHRFAPVAEANRAELMQRQVAMHDMAQVRARQEAEARVPANVRPQEFRPQRLEMPRSPVMAAHPQQIQARNPAFVAPPAHPPEHQNFHPQFQAPVRPMPERPHPAAPANRPEPRRPEPHRPPHASARPDGQEARPPHPPIEARPPHQEPKIGHAGGDHPKASRYR